MEAKYITEGELLVQSPLWKKAKKPETAFVFLFIDQLWISEKGKTSMAVIPLPEAHLVSISGKDAEGNGSAASISTSGGSTLPKSKEPNWDAIVTSMMT